MILNAREINLKTRVIHLNTHEINLIIHITHLNTREINLNPRVLHLNTREINLNTRVILVITVSRSTWKTKNQIQWSRHRSFFCLGVIGHRKCLSFYKN